MKKTVIILICITMIFCEPIRCYNDAEEARPRDRIVYIAPTGERYHFRASCAGKNAMARGYNQVKARYTPCRKCVE